MTEPPEDDARVASLNLLAEVLTVNRMDWGLRDAAVGGPRETVAVATFSETVRRERVGLSYEEVSIIASFAFTAADRWLRRDGMAGVDGGAAGVKEFECVRTKWETEKRRAVDQVTASITIRPT